MNDLISRQAAIDALGERPVIWSDNDDYTLGERNQYDMDRLAIETVPSAQPTLYGYDIKHLAFVASIMGKKGVSPEEAVTIFRDVNRVIEMMLEDMKEMQENALKQTLKKPWEGGQDG